jgi:phosphatidate cytidylyltransferase
MLLLFIGAVLWSKWSAMALFAVIMIGGLVEFFNLCRKRGYQPMYAMGIMASLCLFCTIALPAALKVDDILSSGVAFALIVLVMIVPALFVCEIWRKSTTPIANIATTFMGVMYVALPMSLLIWVPNLIGVQKAEVWEPWKLLAFMSIIWANDVFAYLFGIAFGKHRLCERISPKKSWEGFFGGLVGAVGLAVLFGYLFEANMVRWAIMGLIAAVTGVAGDLVESMFKREVDVKDSGRIMPGHGGFLDRFDALFISVPFVVFYLAVSLMLEI